MVATVADETYEQNEASLGESSTLTDLAGMISYLDKLAAIPKATLTKTTLVPRLAVPPVSAITAPPASPLPSGTAGVAALAVSIAST